MPLAAVGCRFALLTVFGLAGVAKLRSRPEFEQAVMNFQLVPDSVSRRIARLLPWVEIGAATLLGVGIAITPVAAAVALLLCGFTVAISINLARGRKIECGCFGAGASGEVTAASLARNLLLILMTVMVAAVPVTSAAAWRGPGPPPVGLVSPMGTFATGLFTVLAALLAMVIAEGVSLWRTGPFNMAPLEGMEERR